MNKKILSVITGLSIVTLSIGLFAPVAFVAAQATSGGGQGLEIGPPLINLRADPGETITTQINIRDVTNTDLVVTGQINDFIASGEDGTPKLILDDNQTSPYSIKDWISPLPELTLKSKQILPYTITIDVPDNAAPGGYYGVVRFTGNPPELKGTGVSLSASLGSLVLLTVNGDVKENLSIAEFSANQNGGKSSFIFENTSNQSPITFNERFKNDGNIHEQPTGQITVTDMFGNKVATMNVNSELFNVLPGSIRKFSQPLDSKAISNKILFGKYTANLRITYGTDKTVLTQSITFWVIPYTLIAIIILILIAIFFAIRYAIKRYNRYIRSTVLKEQRSHRPPTRRK